MTLDTLTSALNQGGQHLGDLIWWTLAEARIDRSTLEKIWSGAQLAPEFLPDPPTAEKALKAAVREAAIGQHDRLIRLGKEDEAEIVFAIVRETRHEDGSVTYQHETRVILDRQAESVSSDIPGQDCRCHRYSARWRSCRCRPVLKNGPGTIIPIGGLWMAS